ncbi:unnamed protein product [Caenorhabditis auriculariae]|uniref:Major sperm protein n=1 Tax=Caenorhabditis auriculariae TaxID=2777116 RepID=A0A8S1HK07_9PELO|nr:unnamed protein product [Caenorhabditis auriculariae]
MLASVFLILLVYSSVGCSKKRGRTDFSSKSRDVAKSEDTNEKVSTTSRKLPRSPATTETSSISSSISSSQVERIEQELAKIQAKKLENSRKIIVAVKADRKAAEAALKKRKQVDEDPIFVKNSPIEPKTPPNIFVKPNQLKFKPTGGMRSLKIFNKTEVTQNFKVKFSDKMIYRVDKKNGEILPKSSIRIKILRENAGPKCDRIALVFDAEGGDRHVMTVPLIA